MASNDGSGSTANRRFIGATRPASRQLGHPVFKGAAGDQEEASRLNPSCCVFRATAWQVGHSCRGNHAATIKAQIRSRSAAAHQVPAPRLFILYLEKHSVAACEIHGF